MPTDNARKNVIDLAERMDQMRPVMEVARKHKTVVRIHTGVVMGYPLTHNFWPESLHPIWATNVAAEFPDVPIVLDHGGLQG